MLWAKNARRSRSGAWFDVALFLFRAGQMAPSPAGATSYSSGREPRGEERRGDATTGLHQRSQAPQGRHHIARGVSPEERSGEVTRQRAATKGPKPRRGDII